MLTIVFLERDTLKAEVRRPSFEHVWRDYGSTRPEEVFERLEGATVAVVNKLPLRADVLARLPTLRLIAVAATGTDNIDLDFCRERRIEVSNVRGYARDTLPEHVLMLILALRRNLLAYVEAVREGRWQRAGQFCLHEREIRDLHGSTLGLVGHGTLGRGVERLARVRDGGSDCGTKGGYGCTRGAHAVRGGRRARGRFEPSRPFERRDAKHDGARRVRADEAFGGSD
jgi:glycerate dehydrogenase